MRTQWSTYAIHPAEQVRMMRQNGVPEDEIETLFNGSHNCGIWKAAAENDKEDPDATE